ncbi:hypothetical protein ACH5RR_035689 [Cinchona calisaya]|uniref:Transposase n=1 Tax=Cinchona calisaya TaxID=153742 RepID=A0ABD2Y4Z0_9GENT
MEYSGEDDRDAQAHVNLEHEEDTEIDDDYDDIENLETEAQVVQRKDWKRVRKIYDRSKQYIFVAATLPVNGKKAAGGVLKRMYPDASWVTGNYFHCHNPRLEQKWIEVMVDTQVGALLSVVNDGYNSALKSPCGIIRTMVFANTVEAVAEILKGAGIECFCYHSDTSLDVRFI